MRNVLLILSIAICCILSSCHAGWPCEEPSTVFQGTIFLDFKHRSTGNYLYPERNSLYNVDSVKIFNDNGDTMGIYRDLAHNATLVNRYYRIQLAFFGPHDDVSFQRELCRKYFIHYNSTDRDTFQVCFRSRELKCGSKFDYSKLYYKGNLVTEYADGQVIEIFKD